ncbi:Crp/Fnr family transcriptional regulator [Sphingobacterium sp. LRF_L2]|uniref:Crp/Fnr family transcriptional regulator n=1 Tax=Sphingobacterium sp. LRF_L2 TaxID=3369421 RepID=UPI003F6100AA
MEKITNNNPGLRLLLAFWSKHCALEYFHTQWIKENLEIIPVRRNQVLHWADEPAQNIYFVCKGILARVTEEVHKHKKKRRIQTFALPNSSLMTTLHPFTGTLREGSLVALRTGIVIRIPNKAIELLQAQDPQIATFIHILNNKKQRHLFLQSQILRPMKPFSRYLAFTKYMPEIQRLTTQQEQADFLNVSRDSIQKAQKFLLKSKSS